MTLGQIIKQYREEHDLSMSEFARLSGMSKSYVSALEKDRHPKTGKRILPSTETVKAAADAMGITITQLRAMIEPLDWTSEIHDVEPTPEDFNLDYLLWQQASADRAIGEVPHLFEIRKAMEQMDEKSRLFLVEYAQFLLDKQKKEDK